MDADQKYQLDRFIRTVWKPCGDVIPVMTFAREYVPWVKENPPRVRLPLEYFDEFLRGYGYSYDQTTLTIRKTSYAHAH
jgi:hypothetical protein